MRRAPGEDQELREAIAKTRGQSGGCNAGFSSDRISAPSRNPRARMPSAVHCMWIAPSRQVLRTGIPWRSSGERGSLEPEGTVRWLTTMLRGLAHR